MRKYLFHKLKAGKLIPNSWGKYGVDVNSTTEELI
jgi:hypothetical protein